MIRTYGRLTTPLVVALGAAAAFAAATSATASAQPAAPGARAVADWSLIAQSAIVVVGKKFPGEAAGRMGIVHATIYDAVVAIEAAIGRTRSHQPYRRTRRWRRPSPLPRASCSQDVFLISRPVWTMSTSPI